MILRESRGRRKLFHQLLNIISASIFCYHLSIISILLVKYTDEYGLTRLPRNVLKKRHTSDIMDPGEVNEEGKYVGNFNRDCSEILFVSPYRRIVKIEPDPEIFKQKSVRCHWSVFGTEHCIPVLNCKKFSLNPDWERNPDNPCSEEYLEVTDGSSGLDRYCDTNGPKNVTTRAGLRDLYITFKGVVNPDKVKKRGLKCTVFCSFLVHENNPELKESRAMLPDNYEATTNEFCTCGRKPPGNRIVGGEDTTAGEFPWTVALVTSGTRNPYCGGTIINDKFILTAAHCFKGLYTNRKNFQILLGARELNKTSTIDIEVAKPTPEELAKKDAEDSSLRFDVEEYFIHPLYVRQTNDYDIGLIRVNGTIDFHKYQKIQPICMPNLATYNNTYENVQAIVVGWGLGAANATETMPILQKLDVPVLENKDCKSFFKDRFSRRMLCAGFKKGEKDACKGDSGSGLYAEKSKQLWQILGTVSWGEQCAMENSPGVYQRVSEVNQWIRYIANIEDGIWCRE